MQTQPRVNSRFFCLFAVFRPSVDWLTRWWGQSFLSLPPQLFISSRTPFSDTPRSHVLPAIWTSLGPDRLTHKMNHRGAMTFLFYT